MSVGGTTTTVFIHDNTIIKTKIVILSFCLVHVGDTQYIQNVSNKKCALPESLYASCCWCNRDDVSNIIEVQIITHTLKQAV